MTARPIVTMTVENTGCPSIGRISSTSTKRPMSTETPIDASSSGQKPSLKVPTSVKPM